MHWGHEYAGMLRLRGLAMKAFLKKLSTVAIAIAFLVVSATAFTQSLEASKEDALKSADEVLNYIGKWIREYEVQLRESDPVEKAKYEEWLGELKKLQELVLEAAEKIKECQTVDCVNDQSSLIAIARQQVNQLIKEAEERLGDSARFGEETGREITEDEELLGDNTFDETADPYDALDETTGDKAGSSDNNEGAGGITGGDLLGQTGMDQLPGTNPIDESSLQ